MATPVPLGGLGMRVDLFVHFDALIITEQPAASADALTALTAAVIGLRKDIQTMSGTQNQLDAEIADLQAKVEAETGVTQSAVTLLNGIPALIATAVAQAQAAGATDAQLAAMKALGNTIAQNTGGLAGAVEANTSPPAPAAPAAA
jgi:hypothetical protein